MTPREIFWITLGIMIATFAITSALCGEATWLVLCDVTLLILYYVMYIYFKRKYEKSPDYHILSQIGQYNVNEAHT